VELVGKGRRGGQRRVKRGVALMAKTQHARDQIDRDRQPANDYELG
jgi:hypothetical protein